MSEPGASEPEIVVELSLAVIQERVAADEMRLWWRSRETRVNDLVENAPKLVIGRTEVPGLEPPGSDGPAGRISALLFREGTLPEYRLPTLDAELVEDILRCLDPQPTDMFGGTERGVVEPFLRRHAGEGVLAVSAFVE